MPMRDIFPDSTLSYVLPFLLLSRHPNPIFALPTKVFSSPFEYKQCTASTPPARTRSPLFLKAPFPFVQVPELQLDAQSASVPQSKPRSQPLSPYSSYLPTISCCFSIPINVICPPLSIGSMTEFSSHANMFLTLQTMMRPH